MAACAALVLVLAPACGGDDDDDAAPETAEEQGGGDATLEVTATDFDDVTAPAGGTLAVSNSSGSGHTFTAEDDEFDEALGEGETVTVDVPAEPGEYGYFCEIHPSMTGTLTAE